MSVHVGVWGDSVSTGFKDCEMGGWVDRLKINFMNSEKYSAVYNCGINGDTTNWLVKRFHIEAKSRGPGVIIFAIGKNDSAEVYNIDEGKFEGNLNALAKESKSFSKKIIFVSVGNVDESKTTPFPKGRMPYYYNERIVRYNSIIEKVCEETECEFISVYGIFDIEEDLFDGVHPNAVGHQKIFEKVLPVVEGMIGEVGNG